MFLCIILAARVAEPPRDWAYLLHSGFPSPTGETVFSKPSKMREKSMKNLPEPELRKTLQNPRNNAVFQAFFQAFIKGSLKNPFLR